MGLTVAYALQTKTKNLTKVRELIRVLHAYATELPMQLVQPVIELGPADFKRDPESTRKRSHYEWLDTPGGHSLRCFPTHQLSFLAEPGVGCETLGIGLVRYPGTIEITPEQAGRNSKLQYLPASNTYLMRTRLFHWCWHDFCKTEYASSSQQGGSWENFLRCHLCVVAMLDKAQELGLLLGSEDESDYRKTRNLEDLTLHGHEWDAELAARVHAEVYSRSQALDHHAQPT